jgi:hypothetical protein
MKGNLPRIDADERGSRAMNDRHVLNLPYTRLSVLIRGDICISGATP